MTLGLFSLGYKRDYKAFYHVTSSLNNWKDFSLLVDVGDWSNDIILVFYCFMCLIFLKIACLCSLISNRFCQKESYVVFSISLRKQMKLFIENSWLALFDLDVKEMLEEFTLLKIDTFIKVLNEAVMQEWADRHQCCPCHKGQFILGTLWLLLLSLPFFQLSKQ